MGLYTSKKRHGGQNDVPKLVGFLVAGAAAKSLGIGKVRLPFRLQRTFQNQVLALFSTRDFSSWSNATPERTFVVPPERHCMYSATVIFGCDPLSLPLEAVVDFKDAAASGSGSAKKASDVRGRLSSFTSATRCSVASSFPFVQSLSKLPIFTTRLPSTCGTHFHVRPTSACNPGTPSVNSNVTLP
mmetsp:Transcript_18128/g.49468  ORF Transcript_18128/g.49468 Transcript_18128/m.49468 type:complete len:186 (+) Transcript_18128:1039-1596(+)